MFVSLLLLLAVLAVFIVPKLQEEGDTYFINFKEMSVNGVNEGSFVKYQGVKIGQVSRMNVNPRDLSSILVYVSIKKGFPVKKDMRARLQYAGITGRRFVEISGGKTESETLEPGGEILMGSKGPFEKAEDIVLNVDSVVDAINNILNPQNRQKISGLLSNIEKSTGVLARVLQKREKNLQNFFLDIEQTTKELSKISQDLGKFTNRISSLTENIRLDKVVENGDRMFRNISDRFSTQEFGRVINNFDTFVETATLSIRKIEQNVNELEGELSKTLESLRESMENIARFTRDLREDPTLLIRTRTQKRSKK